MEVTDICLNIGERPYKLVAVYISPLRSLCDAELSEYISGGKPILLSGDLNAKHKDWNSRRNSPKGVLLKEFASTNSEGVLKVGVYQMKGILYIIYEKGVYRCLSGQGLIRIIDWVHG